MAMTGGTVIPVDVDAKTKEALINNIDNIKDALTTHSKWQLKQWKKERELQKEAIQKEENYRQQELRLQNILTPPTRVAKLKEKFVAHYQKFVVQGKLFQTVKKSFGKLIAASGSGFMKILKFLLIGAVFPGLLDTLINIFLNIALMLINVLARHAPRIIMTMIRILTDVLPKAFVKIIGAIFPALSNMFDQFAKKALESGNGVIATIFGGLRDFFANKNVISFFQSLGKLIPYIIAFMAASKIYMLLMMVNPVMLAVIGLTAAFIAFYKWGDKILVWMDDLPKYLEERFGVIGVVLGSLFSSTMGLIRPIIQLIQDLKNAEGFGDIFLAIQGFMWDMMIGLAKFALTIPKLLFDLITSPTIWEPIGQSIDKTLNALWFKFIIWLSGISNSIIQEVVKLGIKLGNVVNTFFSFLVFPFKWLGKKIVEGFNWIGEEVMKGFLSLGTMFESFVMYLIALPDTINQLLIKFKQYLWKNITSLGKWMWSGIKSVFSPVLSIFRRIKDAVMNVLQPVINMMIPVFTELQVVLSTVYDVVANTIGAGFLWIKRAVQGVVDFMSAIAENPLAFARGDMETVEKAATAKRLVRAEAERSGRTLTEAQREAREQKYIESGQSVASMERAAKALEQQAMKKASATPKIKSRPMGFDKTPTNTNRKVAQANG